MATKKYFTDESLSALINQIKTSDAESLASAKAYIDTEVAKKANSSHTHDDRYYTESEVDTKISGVNSTISTHTGNTTVHITSSERTNWNSAYTHSTSTHAPSNAERNIIVGIQKNGTDLTVNSSTRKVNITVPTTAAEIGAAASGHNHDGVYDTKGSANSALASAKTYSDTNLATAKSYADEKIAALLDGASDITLDSIKELADAIKENDSAIDALNDIASGKANATHTHAISDVTGLQTALDDKATIVALTNAINEAKENASNKDAVVLSEVQKNIDVVQTNLDTHIADTTKHITSTERTNWGTAYTHSQTAHAPSNAQANVIESIKVNGTAQTITSKSVNITVPTKASDIGAATTSHSHAISDITNLQTTLNNVSSSISTNSSNIQSNSTAISNLQTVVDELEEITSAEIQSLFAN